MSTIMSTMFATSVINPGLLVGPVEPMDHGIPASKRGNPEAKESLIQVEYFDEVRARARKYALRLSGAGVGFGAVSALAFLRISRGTLGRFARVNLEQIGFLNGFLAAGCLIAGAICGAIFYTTGSEGYRKVDTSRFGKPPRY